MNSDVSVTQEAKVTMSIKPLEEIIRKVVHEELMAFVTQEQGTGSVG